MKDLSKLICDFLAKANQCDGEDEFLTASLPLIRAASAAKTAALIQAAEGAWSVSQQDGEPIDRLPSELLATAADRESSESQDTWLAVPWPRHHRALAHAPRMLLLKDACSDKEQLEAAVRALAGTLELVAARRQAIDRAKRAEAFYQLDVEEHTNESFALVASELVGADRTVVLRAVAAANRVVPSDWPEQEWELDDGLAPLAESLAGRTSCRSGQLDTTQFAALRQALTARLQLDVSSCLTVPLVDRSSDQAPLGLLLAVNKQSGRDFSNRDQEHLQQLARWLAERWQQAPADAARQAHQQLIGISQPIADLRARIARVAPTDLAVLILGENGTGKEVVSRLIHRLSPRKDQPFFAINCAALSESLLDSELFGHEKGAFTDASESKPGKFEAAGGGTLFLDEIGELTLRGQAKLLRAIEEKTVVRVGGSQSIEVDVRVLAATNRELPEMVRAGTFREDLFFRLNVVTLKLPALRERREDIEPLANHFLGLFAARAGHTTAHLTPGARQALRAFDWPGNVRQLRNVMERAAFMSTSGEVNVDELDLTVAGDTTNTQANLTAATRGFQMAHIESQVAAADGNMTEAAKRLGLHRSNLYRKMRQLGMHTDEDAT